MINFIACFVSLFLNLFGEVFFSNSLRLLIHLRTLPLLVSNVPPYVKRPPRIRRSRAWTETYHSRSSYNADGC